MKNLYINYKILNNNNSDNNNNKLIIENSITSWD